ncbi:hypothetical protein SBI_07614 [Streptomyces bingchenggensis BCW-1]|uniref:Uncharacterized protein n=1 Tax=Streptomyces bingchenggensis (strain BCW-1) TaxID=749414 RepID=D7CB51_STRBB|nr:MULTISPECIES: hypothetical protein [Streptomyces]ADI10734.1 hypothetical protein SBI_07614 [Streptomyces bingchenggensis BCW-1]
MNRESWYAEPEYAGDPDREAGELTDRLGTIADEVTIGPAPYPDVVRAGRRRRARRRVGATALAVTAVLVAGGVGLGQFGDFGQGGTASAAAPASAPAPLDPVTTVVGKGKVDGKRWQVSVTVYGPARTKEEAHRQYDLAMRRGDAYPVLDGKWEGGYPKTLRIGVTWFSTRVTEGTGKPRLMSDWVSPKRVKGETLLGGSYQHQGAEAGPVGMAWLDPKVERVVVHWKGGTTDEPKVVPVKGTDVRWIVSERPGHGVSDDFIDLYDGAGKRTRMGPAMRLEDLKKKLPVAVKKEQLEAVTKAGRRTPVEITTVR